MGLKDLFKPAWQSENQEKASKSFAKITGQRELTKVARKAFFYWIRVEAIEKLDDCHQVLFAEIAKNDENVYVLDAVFEKLKDQTLLAEIAKNDLYLSVRWRAVGKLENQELLAEIAKNDIDASARSTAIGKLDKKFQELFVYIAKNDEKYYVRYEAAKKLIDQTLAQSIYVDILKNEPDFHYAEEVVKKITDQALLADVAKNGRNDYFSGGSARYALKKLISQTLLVDVARNAKISRTREAAIEKISDPKQRQELLNERDKQRATCTHKWEYLRRNERRNDEDFSFYDDIYECAYCGSQQWRDVTFEKRW